MRELNEMQQRLVEENHNLIYSFLNSRSLSLDAIEDWYGTAAIGLCKAALIFDESRGVKFSTLAYFIMDNEVKRVKRAGRKEVLALCSLDEEVNNETEITLGETVEDKEDCFFRIEVADTIRSVLNTMSPRDREIVLSLTREGATQRSVSKQYGLSQPTVSRIYKNYLESVRGYLEA